jgi:hypothetical protein
MSILQLLNSENFNIFTFAALIKTEDEAKDAAYELELLPTAALCPQCPRVMSEERRPDYKLGFRWRCRRRTCNGPIKSPLENTFFSRSQLSFLKIFRLIVCWYFRISVTQAILHCEVDNRTAVDFYKLCREICRVVHTHDEVQIGGPGDVVEVDESHLFTPKHHRGRPLALRALWDYGFESRT